MDIGAIPRRLVAAHLAFLAVAPLCLFPFVSEAALAKTVLWLSGPAFIWAAVLVPHRADEIPPLARLRFLRSAASDPVLGMLALLVVFAVVRLAGEGVSFGYDAAAGEWCVTGASAFWPCAATGQAFLPFASAVGTLVLTVTLLHSCDAAGRAAFLDAGTCLAGVAGIGLTLLRLCGNASVSALAAQGYGSVAFCGIAFGVWLVASVWRLLLALNGPLGLRNAMLLAVVGNAFGLFLLAPATHYCLFAVTACVLAVTGLVRTRALLPLIAVVILAVPVSLGLLLPGFRPFSFPGSDFFAAHAAVGSTALAAWRAHPWFGSGVGTFDIDLRLLGTEPAWQAAEALGGAVTDAFRRLLAERGAVGVLLPLAALALMFGRIWRAGDGRPQALEGARFVMAALVAAVALDALLDASVLWIGAAFSVFAVLAAATETQHG